MWCTSGCATSVHCSTTWRGSVQVDYRKVAAAASRAPADYGAYIREIADFLLRRASP
jgi:hypothetical protein